MGYTDKYRFTEWCSFDHSKSKLDFGHIWGTELYGHVTPTTSFNDENTNLADKPDMISVVDELRKTLQAGWRDAVPLTNDKLEIPSLLLLRV